VGQVRHRRFKPVEHGFAYKIFMVWLDIDTLQEQLAISPLSGYERSRLASFREKDHFGDASLPLRERLRQDAAAQGLKLPDGPVYLLTHLRYAGYCFNPISLYYCYEPEAREPSLVMAEVHSTFGESHNYWIEGDRADGIVKRLHVSPFNTMDNQYDFRMGTPGETLAVHIDVASREGKFFDATLSLKWRPWTRANLHRVLAQFPLMTLQVIFAIHWEALKLFFKRLPIVPHPSKL